MKLKIGDKVRVTEDVSGGIICGFSEGDELIITDIEKIKNTGENLYCFSENDLMGLPERYLEKLGNSSRELTIDKLKKMEGITYTIVGLNIAMQDLGISFFSDTFKKEIKENGFSNVSKYAPNVEFFEVAGKIVAENNGCNSYMTKIKIDKITEVCMDLKEVLMKKNAGRKFLCTDNNIEVRNNNEKLECFTEKNEWSVPKKTIDWNTASYRRI